MPGHACQHIHMLACTWIHKTRAVTVMCGCWREREQVTHWHKQAKTSLWSFLAQLWRWELGRSCSMHWKCCPGRSYHMLFLPGRETFPHTRRLEKQNLCPDLPRETLCIPCAPAVMQINSYFNFKKKTILSISLLHFLMSARSLCYVCPRRHRSHNLYDIK